MPHGITSCVMLPTVMERVKDVMPGRMADLAVAMGVDTRGMAEAEAEAASAACEAVRGLIRELEQLSKQLIHRFAEPQQLAFGC